MIKAVDKPWSIGAEGGEVHVDGPGVAYSLTPTAAAETSGCLSSAATIAAGQRISERTPAASPLEFDRGGTGRNSLTTEEEQWAEALAIERIHGSDTGKYIETQIGALTLAGDEEGVARFWSIVKRLDQLQNGSRN